MLAKMQLQRPAGITRPLARATVSVHAVARPSRAASTVAPATPATPALSLPLAAFAAAAAPLLLAAEPAFATGGAFGILEGRTAALVHPAVMAILFGTTLYAGYLGLQWRRVRTIGDDIKGLKAQLPKPVEGAEAAPPSPIAEQVAVLEKVRLGPLYGGRLCLRGGGVGEGQLQASPGLRCFLHDRPPPPQLPWGLV
jgi:hypothetical protein